MILEIFDEKLGSLKAKSNWRNKRLDSGNQGQSPSSWILAKTSTSQNLTLLTEECGITLSTPHALLMYLFTHSTQDVNVYL